MTLPEILVNLAFYVFALGGTAAAVAVALSKNIVRSAFSLLGVLFSTAALYAFMRADFIVAAQIIIYVGGILVLIIFAVMLTHKITDVKLSNESASGPAAIFATLCVLFALVVVIGGWKWDRTAGAERVLAPAGKGAVEVGLAHGDGATGVAPGGTVLGDVAFLRIAVIDAPEGATAARLQLQHSPRARDGSFGDWKETPFRYDLLLSEGQTAAEQRVKDLGPGKWRWSARFLKGDAPEGAPLLGTPFTAERGLTRPLGVALAGRWLLAFEVISVLLLAALIGAAFLARKEVKE